MAQLSFHSDYGANQELIAGLHYSAGLAGSWELSEKLLLEVLLLYRRKGFTVRYGFNTGADPLGIPEKTVVELAYAEVPLGVQFRLMRYKRMILSGATGLFGSYLLQYREITWLDDGRLFNTTPMYVHTLSTFLWGLRGGLSAAYAPNQKLLFFITPAYQYTVNDPKSGTQQIRLQEYTFRTGLRFSL